MICSGFPRLQTEANSGGNSQQSFCFKTKHNPSHHPASGDPSGKVSTKLSPVLSFPFLSFSFFFILNFEAVCL